MSTQSPSSTLPANASSTSSSTQNNGFLGGPASPPLILALLAVGVFGIGVASMLGWRRARAGRSMVLGPFGVETLGIDRNEARRQIRQDAKAVGEKPLLWDLSSLPFTPRDGHTQLGDFLPISTYVARDTSVPAFLGLLSLSPSGRIVAVYFTQPSQ
ncbi:hypothetical protein OE88DRAFT_1737201 [Heliocybe sulcata]|uniref:Uncharacterized protein n=1 Tax=Heliocybe sulcata TaxID=5364 RepID=A0A5C3MVJ9_9AGAM|nr:hypothetical protein OE88DRAFT_1737201 [Heliocybe sulcata]